MSLRFRLPVARYKKELGITPTLGRLLAVDWAPSATEGDKVLYLFDGGELAPEAVEEIRPQAEELKSVTFVARTRSRIGRSLV
ncbi:MULTISPECIES: hypothetical protein [unclassified Streptomyces]|uniref:hypothetical protein n=1 Tax=unclassified Streptomyces TaxID=2593676 RepID=UPI00381FEF4E